METAKRRRESSRRGAVAYRNSNEAPRIESVRSRRASHKLRHEPWTAGRKRSTHCSEQGASPIAADSSKTCPEPEPG